MSPSPLPTEVKVVLATLGEANMSNYNISYTVPQSIFRAYDIRGVVDDTFTEDNIYTIGLAIGSEALDRGEHTIAIGRDGRLSGPALSQALQEGIAASGCNVINIGMVATPVLYYATHTLNTRSGVMLTGSHNPPEYNGIKIVIGGETLFEQTILKLHQRIISRDLHRGNGNIENNTTLVDDYTNRIVGDIKLSRPLKVVIDCGNGVGGIIAPRLFRELGCEVIELFCDVDGHFPNHHPDPSVPKNLQDIINYIKKHQADVGFAFDGDADRVGVVTNTGDAIAADRLLMFFALDILTRHPRAVIPYDVKCTRHLATQIAAHGGQPLMVQTGHSLVKAKMKQVGALLAGEFSGHIFFKERWYGFDDGIYAAARCAELLAKEQKSSHAIFAALPNSVITPELKIAVDDNKKFLLMKEIINKMHFADDAKITTIDGLRVDFKNGFGIIRPSNTTPYLVLRFEGEDEAALKYISDLFKAKLLAIDPSLQLVL